MMFAQKLGHKPVLGSRVAVPIAGDFYIAATVQAVRNDVAGHEYVTVKFDDNNKGECPSSVIVGNGFKSIHDIKLHKNQKVFTTHNGREVVGSVEDHSHGLVRVNLPNSEQSVNKREEDIRLTESRYSPRLQDHELDYRKIASVNASPNHGKKRPVSASIEVPQPGRARKSSAEPTMDELMAAMVLSNLSSSPIFHNALSPTIKKGGSPHSFSSSGVGSWGQETQMSPVPGELTLQMGGRMVNPNLSSTPERTKSVIQHTHSIEHSPSSTGDPIEVDTTGGLDNSVPMEEDIKLPFVGVVPPGHSTPAPFQGSNARVQYQAPAGSSPSQNPAFITKQGVMLEPVKEEPNDRENEKTHAGAAYQQPHMFYVPSLIHPASPSRPEYMYLQISTPPPPLATPEQYRELGSFPAQHRFQADVRNPVPNNTCMYVGSPSTPYYTIPVMGSSPLGSNLPLSVAHVPSPLAARNDRVTTNTPPYQTTKMAAMSHPVRIPGLSVLKSPTAQPINIPGLKAFSWHSTGQRSFSPKPSVLMQRQHMHQAASPKMSYSMSPKTMPSGRKIRGDGKKCRKVYGMENRDMWCTSCRWKKACQRFPD